MPRSSWPTDKAYPVPDGLREALGDGSSTHTIDTTEDHDLDEAEIAGLADLLAAEPEVSMEITRLSLVIEGRGAVATARALHEALDAGRVPVLTIASVSTGDAVTTRRPALVIRLVRGERGSTVRIEGRG